MEFVSGRLSPSGRAVNLEMMKERNLPAVVKGNFIGAEGDRTPNLRIANAALSQLSYGPFAPSL
jgi:hypothetical protein